MLILLGLPCFKMLSFALPKLVEFLAYAAFLFTLFQLKQEPFYEHRGFIASPTQPMS